MLHYSVLRTYVLSARTSTEGRNHRKEIMEKIIDAVFGITWPTRLFPIHNAELFRRYSLGVLVSALPDDEGHSFSFFHFTPAERGVARDRRHES